MPLLQADGHDDRTIEGVARRRPAARRAGGLHRARRRAVRHLHARGWSWRRSTCSSGTPQPTEADIRDGARRQSVPLHRLHADLRSGAAGLRRGRGSAMRGHLLALRAASRAGSRRRLAPARRDEPGVWQPFAGGTDLMVLLEAGKLPHRTVTSASGTWRSCAESPSRREASRSVR